MDGNNGMVNPENFGVFNLADLSLFFPPSKQYTGIYKETDSYVEYTPFSPEEIRDMDFTTLTYVGSYQHVGVDEYICMEVMLGGEETYVFFKRVDREWLQKMENCIPFSDPYASYFSNRISVETGRLNLSTMELHFDSKPDQVYQGLYEVPYENAPFRILPDDIRREIAFSTMIYMGEHVMQDGREFVAMSAKLRGENMDIWFRLMDPASTI